MKNKTVKITWYDAQMNGPFTDHVTISQPGLATRMWRALRAMFRWFPSMRTRSAPSVITEIRVASEKD